MRGVAAALALMALACQGQSGEIERHRTIGAPAPGPAPRGEYEDEADAGTTDASGAAPEAGGGELALEALAQRAALATCRRRLDCCAPAERTGLSDDPAACQQELAEQLAPFLEGVARAVAAGRATYDGIAAAGCLADLEAAACAEARTWEALLLAAHCPIVDAAVPAGEDCRASYECTGGFCQGVDQARDGRCVSPRLADGQPCDRGEDCASGTCDAILDVCAAPQPGNVCD